MATDTKPTNQAEALRKERDEQAKDILVELLDDSPMEKRLPQAGGCGRKESCFVWST